jgi:hypothetical protein
MPKFASVDILFKRAPEGWTFNSSYPRIFGPPSTYLLTDAQKAALEQRLNRVVLMSHVLVFVLIALGVFALFIVPDFADQLEAGSPGAWLLACVVWIVLAATLITAIFFIRHRVIESVLCTARRLGSAQPSRLGFALIEMIKRYTEMKSAKVLMIWIAVALLFSAYDTIVYVLVIPARSILMLFVTIVFWLATLCYAALLVFKLRAQRSGR